ncbi:MAG: hypothetical protein DI586_06135 [Micavibrio aeruginosavorus]|uniref:Peptidoglycan binding-like domain-containing protein n=1 Tax=Micavibrio aeruginosavorus TaxID=349221 RepID=A0A2W5HPE0_9BACT|nr:MAG: hypothetical protein DI586_06135 [Micavibrio aeruginosavorus]
MSKNFEQNFSLKDWVTKRAANMPEAIEEDTVLQVQNGADIIMRHEKMRMPEPPQAIESEQDSDSAVERPMTARIAAPQVPASPTQQIQIVRLLRDLGDRLRQSEKEREILWKELDTCRKLLTDIEDKTNNTEKAYLSIEHKLNAQSTDIQSLNEQAASASQIAAPQLAEESEESKEFRKAIEDKISALETTTGSAVLRIEDAISENGKLARRIEQVTQERAKLLQKMEEMEETLEDTQNALKAKALVLLTDQALASKTGLPQSPAWSGNDTLRSQAAPVSTSDALGLESSPWWKSKKSNHMNKTALASLIVLGLVGGWAISRAGMPSLSILSMEETPVTSEQTTSGQSASEAKTVEPKPAEIDLGAALKPDAQIADTAVDNSNAMNKAAAAANAIEPGALTADGSATPTLENAVSDSAQSQALAAETKAREVFTAEKPVKALALRVKPDAALPATVKVIEKKAFAGDAEAQHDLAAVYTAGHAGVKTNYQKASVWFGEAAHSNIANAQYNLAVLYHQGLGVKQDTQKAIDLYRIAAANKHPEAQYNLGIAHIEGIGADYNPQVAAYYFQQAAASGVVEAAYNMGLIQENGLLGEAQPDEAIFWYKLAADKGNEQAKEALSQLSGQMKMSGADVDQIFARMSAGKAEYVKALTEIPAAPVKPVPKTKAETKPPIVAKQQTAAVKAPVSLAAPTYDPVIVAQIQEQLIRLGLFSGSPDGSADKATQDAVKSYQSMNKLKNDGRPTEDVLVHMLASEMQLPESR